MATLLPVIAPNVGTFMFNAAPLSRHARSQRPKFLAAIVLAFLLVAGCSGDSVSQAERVPAPTAIPAPSGIGADGSELTLEVVDGGQATGRIITDHRGFVVYGVTGETALGEMVCVDDCLSIWIPLQPRDGTVALALDPELFDSFFRSDAAIDQVTYAGVPLYLWSGDGEIGITGGAGIAGIWFALTETAGFVGP